MTCFISQGQSQESLQFRSPPRVQEMRTLLSAFSRFNQSSSLKISILRTNLRDARRSWVITRTGLPGVSVL